MIVTKRVIIKIETPKPTLFINSDCIYSLAIGCNFGTKIIPENYTFSQKFRNYFVAIIGVMIGLQVTADLILQITDYLPSLLGLIVFSWCAHFLN